LDLIIHGDSHQAERSKNERNLPHQKIIQSLHQTLMGGFFGAISSPTQQEYDVLVSLVFNIGGIKNCQKLLSKLNTADYAGACGLYGDNSEIVFILPKGVPEPTGDKLYSHIYSYNYDHSNWSCK